MSHFFGIVLKKNCLEKGQMSILNTLLPYLLEEIFTASFLHHSLDFRPQIYIFIFSLSS